MEYMWLVLIIVLLIIEALTVNLVTVWGAIGALFALITSIFTNNINIQIIVFFLVTTLLLIFTRPFMYKVLKVKKEATNLDSVIGKIGVTLTDVTNFDGRVMVMGKNWAARSFNENIIKKDTKVKILEIKGVKLIVKEVEK